MLDKHPICRRSFLAAAAGAALCSVKNSLADDSLQRRKALAADRDKALIAITLDLEMSRNFPTWETTHWDYEKGNLNDETKQYTREACRRVHERGGVLHTFVVGRTLEQENVDWLKEIAVEGHPIGNHTYDHVNITATKREDLQPRFRRAPWLVADRTPAETIADSIRLTNLALKERLDVEAAGFRTPGGFGTGLADRPDLQKLLQSLGFTWVSGKYPRHPNPPITEPTRETIERIVAAQVEAQPFVYPSGLIEVPMSPISDIGAFRTGRWKLDSFLRAIRAGVTWAIEHRAVFDFLGHPSCLYVTDPEFHTIDLICELVAEAGERAAIVDLDTIALRVKLRT
jgi:hypothetical protein